MILAGDVAGAVVKGRSQAVAQRWPVDARRLSLALGVEQVWVPSDTGLDDRAEDRRDGDPSGGAAPDSLTTVGHRDPFVGTPWHKPVPARVERP